MARVAQEFSEKKRLLGARRAATLLKVSLASFYNYVAGTDLPRTDVLRRATEKWGIQWPWMDTSELLRTREVGSEEQLAFSFIDAVQEADISIIEVRPSREGALQIKLKIHFPPLRRKMTLAKP